MKRYFNIVCFVVMALSLTSCATNGSVIEKNSNLTLKPNYGFIAVRQNSNTKKYKQFLYYNRVDKSSVDNFFSNQMRFLYDGSSELKLEAVPAGNYYWSSFYLSGGKGTTFRKEKSFKVLPNKINYVGDVETTVFARRNRFNIVVKNNSVQARKEISKKSPKLISKYPFSINLSKVSHD